jgi:hypothetical protein
MIPIKKFIHTTHPRFSTIHSPLQTTKQAALRISYRFPYFVNNGKASTDT